MPPPPDPDGGAPTPDGGEPIVDDGGPPPTDAGAPGELSIERWGAQRSGRVLGLHRAGRHLWMNSTTVTDPSTGEVHADVTRLDLDTGEVRVWEDELPEQTIGEGPFAQTGPVATAQTLIDGDRVLMVARSGVLAMEDGVITEHPIAVDGAPVSPMAAALDRTDGRADLWVTGNRGLLRLNADTFAVEEVIGADVLGTEDTMMVAVDPASRAVYVSALFEAIDGSLSTAVLRIVDGALAAALMPGDVGVPEGMVGDLIFSATHGGLFVALASWDPASGGVIRWDGETVEHLVDESVLSRASKGREVAFGAHELALDETDGVLVVGGQLQAAGPTASPIGGGLAWIDLTTLDTELAVAGTSTETSAIAGDHVMALAYDPLNDRTYASLQQPCSEFRLGNAGVTAIHFESGAPAFEMPIMSGVRDVAIVDDRVYLAVRDDVPGLRCEGLDVQGGFVRLTNERRGVHTALRGGDGAGELAPMDTTRLAFEHLALRDSAHYLVAGARNATFAGAPTQGVLVAGPTELGVSLYSHDVTWESDRVFWIGGRATHHPGDPDTLANVGPRGAARVVLDDAGFVESHTQYVLASRDPEPGVVEGLPSSEVTAIVVGESGTWLVSGTERVDVGGDRDEREPFLEGGVLRTGGLSHVAPDGTLTVIARGAELPDGRAAALDADGTLHVLDVERGLLRLDGDELVEVPLPMAVPEGSIPRALWMGAGDDMAIGYSTGALISFGGRVEWIDGVGHVWSATLRGEGVLYLGTDEGLMRVRRADAAFGAEAAAPSGELPRFRIYERPSDDGGGDGGACLGQHEACSLTGDPCCAGLVCSGGGFITECVPE